ncbi:MAG TPA: hypothetical protein VK486_02115, partial [Thermoleophilaceae bacterium]|nr:hypothetical protein [Thermoleophilaceae bacterium]
LDGHVQFVHEDDVVEAVSGLLIGRHAGQFNLAPDGLMTLRECAELLDTPVRRMPLRLYRALGRLLWRLRMSEAPPGQIDFALYPWIVSNEKVKATLGWTPRHTSRETFEITMRAQGKLTPVDPPAKAASGNGAHRPAAADTHGMLADLAPADESMVDELIADRRGEAAGEHAE